MRLGAALERTADAHQSLACSTRASGFRVIATGAAASDGVIRLTPAEQDALQCDTGCTIRVLDMAATPAAPQFGARIS